jgi:S-(hydroxymethyl)glutathione dehydrogenase/alcohol dehydrogenase
MTKNFVSVLIKKKKIKNYNINISNELKPGQVLVKIRYAGICGTQFMEYMGYKGKNNYLPHMMGHEGSGVVHSSYSTIGIKKGDRVVIHWMKGKGKNITSKNFLYKNRVINSGSCNTFAKYSIVSENKCTVVNNLRMDFKKMALFGCSLPTAYGSYFHNIKSSDKKILIFGAGAIGINLIQLINQNKKSEVYICDISNKKLLFAKNLVKKKIKLINLNSYKNKKLLFKKKEFFDIIFESTGNKKNIEKSFDLIKKNKKIVLIGNTKNNSNISINPFNFILGKKIVGSYGGNFKPETDIKKYYSYIKKNKINIKKQISMIYPQKKIKKLFSDYKNGKIFGKVLIKL